MGPSNSSVGYGSHMAIHMALGLLFLGGARYSLKTDNMSIAALLIALFPKFPTHSNDNRYHLQVGGAAVTMEIILATTYMQCFVQYLRLVV